MADETEVGARLVLDPGNFSKTADAAIAKMGEISKAAEEMAAKVEASGVKMSESMAKVDTAGGAGLAGGSRVSRAEQAALDATAVEQAETRKRTAIKQTATEAETAAKKQQSALESLAGSSTVKHLAAFGTGALAVGAYETVKQYSAYNKLVTQSAVDAGANVKELPTISKALLADSRATGVAVNDMANSFYRVQSAMAGTHTSLKQVLALTRDAANLDVLFNVPKGNQTEQMARIMGSMLNTNLVGAQTPQQIEALANVSVGHGDIRGADLISALGKMLPAAKAMGANAFDMTAWVDTLTKQGMQGSQAGTLIAHSVQQLAQPSEQGNKAEQMLGIEGGQLQTMMSTKGIPATVAFLKNAMKQFNPTNYYPSFSGHAQGADSAIAQLQAWGIMDPQTLAAWEQGKATASQQKTIDSAFLNKIFGGAKSALPMLALMNDPQQYANLVQSLHAGATPQALAQSMQEAMNTPGRQMQIARANVAATGIQIGQELTPVALEAFKIVGGIAKELSTNPTALYGILTALTALVGTAVAVSAANKITKLASDIKAIGGTASNIAYKLTGGAIGSASSNLTGDAAQQAAADTQMTAAEMQYQAAMRNVANWAGGAASGVEGAVAKTTAADAGYGTLVGDAAAGSAGAEASSATGGILTGAGAAIIGKILPAAMVAAAITATLRLIQDPSGAISHKPSLGDINHPSWWISDATQLATGPSIVPHATKPGGWRSSFDPLVAAMGARDQQYSNEDPINPFGNWQHRAAPHHKPAVRHQVWRRPFANEATEPEHIRGGIFNPPIRVPAMTRSDQANVSAIQKQVTAAQKLEQAAAKTGDSEAKQEAAAIIAVRASQVLHEAGSKLKEAQTDLKDAAKKHGDAAKKLQDAAKQHATAAAALAASANKMDAAADKLGNTKIQAAVDITGLGAALTQQQANTLARG